MTMHDTLRILKISREARRDAVVRRLNEAKVARESAMAAHRQAQHAVDLAQSARAELNRPTALTAGASWNLSMMNSCDALVQHRIGLAVVAEKVVEASQALVEGQRTALNACERALMRNDEWARHIREETQHRQGLDEQSQDDDLAATMKPCNLWGGIGLSCKV
jgi:hypothetical protein